MKQSPINTLLSVLMVCVIVFLSIQYYRGGNTSDIVDVLVDAGFNSCESSVDAELLKHRKIVITTDINGISSQKIIKGLLLLDALDHATPIDLYIRTEGGWISDTFGIIDTIQSIKAPVNTHAIGGTLSSGAMILAAGTGVRFGYPFSSIMFHAGLSEDDDDYGTGRSDNDRLIRFWKDYSRLPDEWTTGKEDETYYLGPKEALEFGLIDQIVTSPKERSNESKPHEGARDGASR